MAIEASITGAIIEWQYGIEPLWIFVWTILFHLHCYIAIEWQYSNEGDIIWFTHYYSDKEM